MPDPKNISANDELLFQLISQLLQLIKGRHGSLEAFRLSIHRHLSGELSRQQVQNELQLLSTVLKSLLLRDQKNVDPNCELELPKEKFIERLDNLLKNISVPIKFQSHRQIILDKLKKDLCEDDIESVIDSVVSLILNINHSMQSEQHITEKFLEDIYGQLNQLERHTVKAKETNQESIADNAQLNQVIYHQIENIKTSASNALELSTLQNNIALHLQELTTQLHAHKLGLESRQQETQQQLSAMSSKIQELEAEAYNLRRSLLMAHAKAFLDPLTNLPNRMAYNEKVDIEAKYCKRYHTALALIIWDIDHFKLINDSYGHQAGDKTLELVARLMSDNCRETDFIARYGGEEFVMLLHKTSANHALTLAEKIRQTIENTQFHYNGEAVNITISCGISEFNEDLLSPDQVFDQADKALYYSKQNGRNRCTLFAQH